MNDPRGEAVARELAAWEAFQAALARVPRDRWEEPGVVPEWTVKDLLWHMAGWMRRCATNLEAIREDRFVDEETTDEQTDAFNAELAAAARGMSVDDVWTGLLGARELVLRRWSELPAVDAAAEEEIAVETWEHYEEHLPHVAAFAG